MREARVPGTEGGEVVAVCGIVRNVSERKHSEEVLRIREGQLRAAQTLGGIRSWTWDVVSGAVSWSPEMTDLSGPPPSGSGLNLGAWGQLAKARVPAGEQPGGLFN